MTAVLVKIHFFLIVHSAGPLCSDVSQIGCIFCRSGCFFKRPFIFMMSGWVRVVDGDWLYYLVKGILHCTVSHFSDSLYQNMMTYHYTGLQFLILVYESPYQNIVLTV